MFIVNYKECKKTLECGSNKKKFLEILNQEFEEEIQQRKEKKRAEEENLLTETLSFFSKDLNSTKKIKARTFFRVVVKKALDGNYGCTTPEQLFEELIK